MFGFFKKLKFLRRNKAETIKNNEVPLYTKPSFLQHKNLRRINSFEEYSEMVKKARESSKNRLFTNCYLLAGEIERLISINAFYYVKTDSCLIFVDDESAYYYMFLYVDLTKEIEIPKLDKDILVENVYYEGRKTEKQARFEEILKNAGCQFLNTYNAISDRLQLSPEKYWKKLETLERSLALEGKKIVQPTNWQLWQFERVYRSTINKYVQKKYTRKERKQQRDMGYLHCIVDKRGKIYAIQINPIIHGGAIATRKDCQGSIYSPSLALSLNKSYYENMPEDPEAQKEYMRSKAIGGWIAVDNKASWRLYKMLGIYATGKSMNQFVIPAK